MDCQTFDVLGRWKIDLRPQTKHYDFWWNLPRDYVVSSEWGLPPQFEQRFRAGLMVEKGRPRDKDEHGPDGKEKVLADDRSGSLRLPVGLPISSDSNAPSESAVPITIPTSARANAAASFTASPRMRWSLS